MKESGTGKNVFYRWLRRDTERERMRKKVPFVPVKEKMKKKFRLGRTKMAGGGLLGNGSKRE